MPEPDLTDTQKAYNVAESEMFAIAAWGHHRYFPSGESLTTEGRRQESDYNNRITAAREELQASLLRLVAEHAETFPGERGPTWLRSLADDPAQLSLLAVRPDERDFDTEPAASPSAAAQPEPPTNTVEKTVRDHTLALHLIGEQLAGIESWFWEHLATVRQNAVTQPAPTTSRLPELLRAEADQFQAECPDHGTTERRLPKCYCDLAEQQRRRAAAITQPDGKA